MPSNKDNLMLNTRMDDFMQAYLLKGQQFDIKNCKDMEELINDELLELNDELLETVPDKAKIIKETMDIVYITLQRLRRMGVDLDSAFYEVHRSNMSKALPLDGSVNLDKELEIARERYPKAGIKYGQRVAVLICGDTGKVIKPTTYSPATITKEIIGE